MPIGSFDLDSFTPPIAGPAMSLGVFLYTPGAQQPFALLPNVWCLQIDYREGPEPPVARLKYVFDDNLYLNLGWPARIGQVWPINAQGPYVVLPDARIVVMSQNPDGSPLYLFDGFAQIPQADLTPASEGATFTAIGVAAREWDNPISGRVQRDSDPTSIQDTSGDSDVQVDLPCRFNPADTSVGSYGGFQPNRTPDGYATDGPFPVGDYPVFVEPAVEGRPAAQSGAYWSVPDAILYVLAQYNNDETYVQNPTGSALATLLQVDYPDDDTGPFDPATNDAAPLFIRDYDANNKPWPEVVADLLGYAGFVMRWDLQADLDGSPVTKLLIYRRDGASTSPVKSVYLDNPGASLAQGSINNVSALHLARDLSTVVNAWQVETSQRQVEVSIVLAPLYQPAVGDEVAPSRNQFFRGNWTPTTSMTVRRKYRWYGADECGDGYWSRAGHNWVQGAPFDFSKVFPPDDDGSPAYTVRYRPSSSTILAQDANGNPLKAQLAISFDYSPTIGLPEVWNGGGTWYNVTGGWEPLRDRLGINVTVEDPENWSPGKAPMPGGDIKGVTWWANPSAVTSPNLLNLQPALRLTTVIQDDLTMGISAGRRIGSPTRFTRWRVVDAKDHFQYAAIDPSSSNYVAQGGNGTDPYVTRDDTDAANAHAYQLRDRYEMPPLAGSVSLPGIALAYDVGDRISLVSGRNISLQTNIGTAQGEAPVYPWIVSLSWDFDGQQRTTINLSDRRAEGNNAW
jgi:hypothetical protein